MRKANVFPLPVLAAPNKSLTIQSVYDVEVLAYQLRMCVCINWGKQMSNYSLLMSVAQVGLEVPTPSLWALYSPTCWPFPGGFASTGW